MSRVGSTKSSSRLLAESLVVWVLTSGVVARDLSALSLLDDVLEGDDDLELRLSILLSICDMRPPRLFNSLRICVLVSIGLLFSIFLQFLFMGRA